MSQGERGTRARAHSPDTSAARQLARVQARRAAAAGGADPRWQCAAWHTSQWAQGSVQRPGGAAAPWCGAGDIWRRACVCYGCVRRVLGRSGAAALLARVTQSLRSSVAHRVVIALGTRRAPAGRVSTLGGLIQALLASP